MSALFEGCYRCSAAVIYRYSGTACTVCVRQITGSMSIIVLKKFRLKLLVKIIRINNIKQGFNIGSFKILVCYVFRSDRAGKASTFSSGDEDTVHTNKAAPKHC
jgi:hypothetical protein